MKRLSPLAAAALAIACSGSGGETAPSGPATVLHLDAELEAATVVAASRPRDVAERSWSFAGGAGDWRSLSGEDHSWMATIASEDVADGRRITLGPPPQQRGMLFIGGLQIELEEGGRLSDWQSVDVKARTSDRFAGIAVAHNLSAENAVPGEMEFFFSTDEVPPVFNDGSVQTYSVPLRPREGEAVDEPLDSLAFLVGALEEARFDVLELTLVPRGADFPEDVGARSVVRDGFTRASIYAHAPARLTYAADVPAGGRLDFGLSVAPGESVTYRVTVEEGGEESVVFEESISELPWAQRSVDLTAWSGRSVDLSLAAEGSREGSLALWGAPILSGGAVARPNVVFYVIDGAGADFMSLYGYERPTTPFLEELAREAVVFDRAYSNSTWTQPSTVSFMTSLHHSVLGGLRRGVHSTPVPSAATTMAERMRAGGYLTASFTANPNAGRIVGLERGVDVMRDAETEHHSTSSKDLHELYWELRESYPVEPYWVHFQTTDVHEPNRPHEPFAERWVSAEEHERLDEWQQQLFVNAGYLFGTTSIADFYDQALAIAGIDRHRFFDGRRGLYDETMLYQDEQLRLFVERLKAAGEWERTLLVIGADHGHPAGTFARWGRGLLDPQPDPWQGALFDSYTTRVPLMVVWGGTIEGGRRIEQPVSMIDVLPTILDLVGLPQPEVLQGQSLAPLLRGEAMEARPVILDEFRVDESTGEMVGNLEVIDGRWGATLEVGPVPEGADPSSGRHSVPSGGRWAARHPFFPQASRLLLYDLEADPLATTAVNVEHPDLVLKYDRLLRAQWRAHLALAERFGEAGEVALSPEQLQQLRALGYIQ